MNDKLNINPVIETILRDDSTLQLMIESKNYDLNEMGRHGRTPLMAAAAAGLLRAVEILVLHGASVHTKGHYQCTALHEACASGETAIANYLLSLGAEIDAGTAHGTTPLMCAAAFGNLETVRLLLEKGANITKIDCRGATAADIAREKGEDQAADLIESYSGLQDR